VKALTLHQPWASLIALGHKSIETRSWSTKYRGPLAIHAGASVPPYARGRVGEFDVDKDNPRGTSPAYLLRGPIAWPYRLPLGAVVATCYLVDVVRITSWATLDGPPAWAAHMIPLPGADVPRMILVRDATGAAEAIRDDGPLPEEIDATPQLPYGDFTPGRFAWLLDHVQRIEPVPAKGHQGLWEWTPGDLSPAGGSLVGSAEGER
jgi:activating signal cointegrator 1